MKSKEGQDVRFVKLRRDKAERQRDGMWQVQIHLARDADSDSKSSCTKWV